MGDGTGDAKRRRLARERGAYNIGWNDAAKGTVSAQSMATDADYAEGFQAYLDAQRELS